MNDAPCPPLLSPEGRRRRTEMLPMLQATMVRRHRRRRAMRGATGLVLLAAVVGVAAAALRDAEPAPDRMVQGPQAPETSPARPTTSIVRVSTPSGLHERYVHPAASVVERISDAELLQELDEVGQPGALVRTERRAWVVFDGT